MKYFMTLNIAGMLAIATLICPAFGAVSEPQKMDQAKKAFLEQMEREAVEFDEESEAKPPQTAYFFVLLGEKQNPDKWRVAEQAAVIYNKRSHRDGHSVPPIFRNVVVIERETVWVVLFARLGNGNKTGNVGFSGSAATPYRIVVMNKPDLADVTEAYQSEVFAPQVTDPAYSEGWQNTADPKSAAEPIPRSHE